jgi:hypothetical protein
MFGHTALFDGPTTGKPRRARSPTERGPHTTTAVTHRHRPMHRPVYALPLEASIYMLHLPCRCHHQIDRRSARTTALMLRIAIDRERCLAAYGGVATCT